MKRKAPAGLIIAAGLAFSSIATAGIPDAPQAPEQSAVTIDAGTPALQSKISLG